MFISLELLIGLAAIPRAITKLSIFCEVVVRTDTATEIRRISSMNDVFGRFKRDEDVVIPVRFGLLKAVI